MNAIKLSLLAISLAACTTIPVVLVHPDGRVAQCGPYDGRPLSSTASAFREAECVDDFKERGFVRQ